MDNALAITSLTFTHAVSGFTLSIPSLSLVRGEQMLLAAASGKGKSTLLALIAGLLDPAGGSVVIGGQNIHALAGAARDRFRGRHIGMIFQNLNLLRGFSAHENVLASLMFSDAKSANPQAHAAQLLTSLGISDQHRDVSTLSIGQQQRVAIARAVACKPDLVLADEPTSSLDPENALLAMDLIQQTCREQNAALLCVSHDPALKARFTRTQSLDIFTSPAQATQSPQVAALTS